jgi:hypothetical protein
MNEQGRFCNSCSKHISDKDNQGIYNKDLLLPTLAILKPVKWDDDFVKAHGRGDYFGYYFRIKVNRCSKIAYIDDEGSRVFHNQYEE